MVWGLNREFSKKEKMANVCFKKCLYSLAIREMQTKIVLTFLYTHNRMAKTNKTTGNKRLRECLEKESPSLLLGLQMVPATLKISIENPQQVKNKSTI